MPAAAAAPTAMPIELFMVEERTVACDGGDGPLGHPRVYLRIADREVECPYCSRLYRLKEGAGRDHGH